LCDTGSPFGDWWTSTASRECKQIVSACILARMNARGRHVPLSIRVPDHIGRFSPMDKVRVQVIDRGGTPRASGWQPDFVGVCTRGTTVTLQRTTAAAGHAVRACTGINACDRGVTDWIVSGSPAVYSGWLADKAPGEPISFMCPADASTAPYGSPDRAYFSILVDLGPGASPSVNPLLGLTSS